MVPMILIENYVVNSMIILDKYRMYLSGPKKILFLNLRINRYEMLCACHRVFSSDENLRIVIHAQKGPNDRAY